MTENKYVREKLEKVLEMMPNHLSAKILLEYGSRKKPSLLESKYFAISMKSLLDAINIQLTQSESGLSAQKAMDQSEKIATDLEIVEKIISSEDQDLYDKVDKISDQLRSYSKAKKSSNDYGKNNSEYYSRAALKVLRELKTLNNEVQVDLARLHGIHAKKEE